MAGQVSCRLETADTVIEKKVNDKAMVDTWQLGKAIAAAIQAYDAANPVTSSGFETLEKRVVAALEEGRKKK